MSNASKHKQPLTDLITMHIEDFTHVNGHKPSYLYLGEVEWKELAQLAEAFGADIEGWLPGAAEYQGMVVYNVGDWNHLRVA